MQSFWKRAEVNRTTEYASSQDGVPCGYRKWTQWVFLTAQEWQAGCLSWREIASHDAWKHLVL